MHDDLIERLESAEDAILQACLSFEKDPKEGIHERFPGYLVGALAAAGYRILAPGALDAETLERAATVAEEEGVYPELNVWGGGPDWYKHGKRIAAALRALKG